VGITGGAHILPMDIYLPLATKPSHMPLNLVSEIPDTSKDFRPMAQRLPRRNGRRRVSGNVVPQSTGLLAPLLSTKNSPNALSKATQSIWLASINCSLHGFSKSARAILNRSYWVSVSCRLGCMAGKKCKKLRVFYQFLANIIRINIIYIFIYQ